MFRLSNLTFSFPGSEKPLFNGLSFSLENGKLHSVSGANGVGKSTLFRILSGEIPDSEVESVEINSSKIARLPQDYDEMLAPGFTVEENLAFGRMGRLPRLFRRLSSSNHFPELLRQLGVQPTALVQSLSGGQRQALALCMLLEKKPEVCLLDEPTSAMDTTNSRTAFSLLRELAAQYNICVLVISHAPELVAEFCNGQNLRLEVLQQSDHLVVCSA